MRLNRPAPAVAQADIVGAASSTRSTASGFRPGSAWWDRLAIALVVLESMVVLVMLRRLIARRFGTTNSGAPTTSP